MCNNEKDGESQLPVFEDCCPKDSKYEPYLVHQKPGLGFDLVYCLTYLGISASQDQKCERTDIHNMYIA